MLWSYDLLSLKFTSFAFPPFDNVSIVMARHALFPETAIRSDFQTSIEEETNKDIIDGAEDDLDALLATLEGWSSKDETQELSKANADLTDNSSVKSEEVLLDELQAWRTQHSQTSYDEWNAKQKQEFMVSVKSLKLMR